MPRATGLMAMGITPILPAASCRVAVGRPVARGMRFAGPALTVQSPGGDNLWLHRAIYAAQPGVVLVVSVSGAYEHGYWGEIMATAAKVRGLAALVIDGCVRDGELLGDIGFPVFARGLCIRGTGKDFGARGWIGHPTLFDNVTVNAGDLVVGDGDGVVAIPRERADAVIEASRQREAAEADQLRRIEAGETTMRLFNFG